MNDENLEAFEQLLDTHGSDREHWPADARVPADALLRASGEAQRLLREAQALDALLDQVPVPLLAQPKLRARILESLPARPGDWFGRGLDWMAQGRWGLRPAAFAMVPLLIGLGFGLAMTQPYEDDDLTDAFTLLAFEHIEDYDDAQ